MTESNLTGQEGDGEIEALRLALHDSETDAVGLRLVIDDLRGHLTTSSAALQMVGLERTRYRDVLTRIAEGDLNWHRMKVPALPTAEDISTETRRLALAALNTTPDPEDK